MKQIRISYTALRTKWILTVALFVIPATTCVAGLQAESKTGSWGDQGNGTYINPILNADYSDPDVCRVGEKYYMVCSEFHYMGMPVLESDDMVNWKIITQIYTRLNFPDYDNINGYGNGSWAPAIRYHAGKFWVYFCTPTEGLFMTTASKPEGPWAPLVEVKHVEKWEDPCPFWDEDGNAYLGHSVYGAGPIIIHKMSPDGTRLLDDGFTVYTGPVAEGVKMHKKDGYYYISIPEGGVPVGWQTILRSKNIYGPYEKKVVLEQGTTNINGPHQGAIVETPEGEWWFYHFQSSDALGRVVHLQPMHWHDGWPVIGVDIDQNGIGEPVYVWKKPATGKSSAISAPQADDDFNAPALGLQWQFNHNADNSAWSLTEKPGYLSLKALRSDSFLKAKNTLTQKTMGASGEAVAALETAGLTEGQKAGLCSFGSLYGLIGVYRIDGKNYLFFETNKNDKLHFEKQPLSAKVIYLKLKFDFISNKNHFYYSTDNKHFIHFGEDFGAVFSFWKGTRVGLFSYNEQTNGGNALFNWFKYDYEGPKRTKN
ncbi:MAG: glycoside hydrolase 43 family protein [Dysgonamonadaceae bacterium]|jgi:beta-xylosidase|nr:glycoside hydrolase 43 family protein [Dysgonamonadaceae bacterium]